MTLAERIDEAAARARREGALEPITTRVEIVQDGGVRFSVRVVDRIARKHASMREQEKDGRDPFLPPEPVLVVAELSKTHVAVLNKFNVMDRHLVIVTRRFEEQESLLTLSDFEALWRVLAEIDGVFFYNAGPLAGASQRHKHLQVVPAPLGEGPERCPMERFLTPARRKKLPFSCHFESLSDMAGDDPDRAARETRERYLASLAAVGRPGDPRAYNLLVTRDWMLLVPRTRESAFGVSVNALGFAGALLVKNEEELEALRRRGPLAVLREVTPLAEDAADG